MVLRLLEPLPHSRRSNGAKSTWSCWPRHTSLARAGVEPLPVKICSECLSKEIRELNLKEEIVRMAEITGSRVEVVNHSDALMRLGGIGCLLRFLGPERYGAVAA